MPPRSLSGLAQPAAVVPLLLQLTLHEHLAALGGSGLGGGLGDGGGSSIVQKNQESVEAEPSGSRQPVPSLLWHHGPGASGSGFSHAARVQVCVHVQLRVGGEGAMGNDGGSGRRRSA